MAIYALKATVRPVAAVTCRTFEWLVEEWAMRLQLSPDCALSTSFFFFSHPSRAQNMPFLILSCMLTCLFDRPDEHGRRPSACAGERSGFTPIMGATGRRTPIFSANLTWSSPPTASSRCVSLLPQYLYAPRLWSLAKYVRFCEVTVVHAIIAYRVICWGFLFLRYVFRWRS